MQLLRIKSINDFLANLVGAKYTKVINYLQIKEVIINSQTIGVYNMSRIIDTIDVIYTINKGVNWFFKKKLVKI